MKWRYEQPKEPGWYWFKSDCDSLPCLKELNAVIVLVWPDPLFLDHPLRARTVIGSFNCGEMAGQWSGPIGEPK